MLQEADIGIGISGAEGMQVSTINNQTQTQEQFVQDISLYYAFFYALGWMYDCFERIRNH